MTARLIFAEWSRFSANPVNVAVLALFLVVLLVSACWSGWAAREHRLAAASERLESQERLERARETFGVLEVGAPDETRRVASAFNFARYDAPPARLPALGGLALTGNAFTVLTPSQRVTVASRYTDGRKSEQLGNPLLGEVGAMDFATVVALLTPLAALGLAYGLVQEDREQGVWRLVAAQHPQPWQVLRAALLVRWLALLAIMLAASAVAFAFDAESSLSTIVFWLAAASGIAAVWIAIAGILCLLPLSSGSAALGGLAVWIGTVFVAPAVLNAWAAGEDGPSRLAAIAEMRAVQLDVEEQNARLVEQWYREHPQWRHPTRTTHTWPVSFLPRYEAESRRIRPLVRHFDTARAERDARLARWAWLSPSVAMLYVADHLAGIDAGRYLAYVSAVDAYEDQWRAELVPRIMSYRGLNAEDLAGLPQFDFEHHPALPYGLLLQLWGLALGLGAIFHFWREKANRP